MASLTFEKDEICKYSHFAILLRVNWNTVSHSS